MVMIINEILMSKDLKTKAFNRPKINKIPQPENIPRKAPTLCFTTSVSFLKLNLGKYKLMTDPKIDVANENEATNTIINNMVRKFKDKEKDMAPIKNIANGKASKTLKSIFENIMVFA